MYIKFVFFILHSFSSFFQILGRRKKRCLTTLVLWREIYPVPLILYIIDSTIWKHACTGWRLDCAHRLSTQERMRNTYSQPKASHRKTIYFQVQNLSITMENIDSLVTSNNNYNYCFIKSLFDNVMLLANFAHTLVHSVRWSLYKVHISTYRHQSLLITKLCFTYFNLMTYQRCSIIILLNTILFTR